MGLTKKKKLLLAYISSLLWYLKSINEYKRSKDAQQKDHWSMRSFFTLSDTTQTMWNAINTIMKSLDLKWNKYIQSIANESGLKISPLCCNRKSRIPSALQVSDWTKIEYFCHLWPGAWRLVDKLDPWLNGVCTRFDFHHQSETTLEPYVSQRTLPYVVSLPGFN